MIVSIPNPALTRPAKNIEKIDKKVKKIVEDMKKDLLTTINPKGVGLAAPQVGLGLRIFLIKPTEKCQIKEFINPEIIWKSEEMSEIRRPQALGDEPKGKKLEGCLSIPNIWGYLKRHAVVRLKYQDLSGDTHEEEFSGFPATIIQHEMDHLDGVLFTQRVIEQKEKLYEVEKDENGQDRMVEIII